MKLDGLSFSIAGILLGLLIGVYIAKHTSWANGIPVIGGS